MKYSIGIWSLLAVLTLISFVDLITLDFPKPRVLQPEILQRFPQRLPLQNMGSRYFKPKPPHNFTTDTIALYKYLDSEFYGRIGIGNPVRYFNLLVATTWGNTWVLSSDCALTTPACWFHNKYDGTKSSTHIDNGTQFNSNETTYNISGVISTDQIFLDHLNVTNFSFVEVDSLPWQFMMSKADGVLGLAKQDLVNVGSPPLFYALFEQKRIPQPIFTVYINRNPQSPHGGSILLGAINKKRYSGDITYVHSPSPYYWQFDMQSVAVDMNLNKEIIVCKAGCQGIIDTSTTDIVGPNLAIKQINRLIKAKEIAYGQYLVDCETVNKLPHIRFVINGLNFTIKGPDFVRKVTEYGVELCVSGFKSSKSDDNQWILGAAFLGQYYTIFDLANQRVGLATLIP